MTPAKKPRPHPPLTYLMYRPLLYLEKYKKGQIITIGLKYQG